MNPAIRSHSRRLMGIKAPAAIEQRTQAILADYQDRVETCLQQLIPSLTPGWVLLLICAIIRSLSPDAQARVDSKHSIDKHHG